MSEQDTTPMSNKATISEFCYACEYEAKIEHYKKNSPTPKYLPVMEAKLKAILASK